MVFVLTGSPIKSAMTWGKLRLPIELVMTWGEFGMAMGVSDLIMAYPKFYVVVDIIDNYVLLQDL